MILEPLRGLVASVAPEGLYEGDDAIAHRLRGGLLETRPAQSVLIRREYRLLDGFAGASGLALLERVQFVQPLDEQ
jgi:hypothetical protein